MEIPENTYLKRIFILFSGNVLAQVIPFALAPLITRIYTPEELGIQGNFIALVFILGIIANGRYEQALVLPEKDSEAFNILTLSFKITTLISFISLFLFPFRNQIASYYNAPELASYIIFVPVGVLLLSIHNVLIQWLIRQEIYGAVSKIKIILSLSTNALILLFGWLNYGVSGLIVGFLIGFLLSVIFLFFTTSKTIRLDWYDSKEEKKMMRKYKDFPLVNSIHAFSDLFFSEFLILGVLSHHFGIVTAGFYVIMIKYLKAPARFVSNAIGQVFYKEATRLKQQDKEMVSILKKSIRLSLWGALPMLVVVLLAGKTMFSWYLGEGWEEVGVLAKIMIFPIFLNFLTSPISSIPLVFNQQRKSLRINLIGMFISALAFILSTVIFNSIYISLAFLAFFQSLLMLYLLYWFTSLAQTTVSNE